MGKSKSSVVGCKALFSLAILASASAQAAQGVESFAQIIDPAVVTAPVYAGVSLNNLSVTLVDLDPNDGITPGITYHIPSLYYGDEQVGGGLYSDGARSFTQYGEDTGESFPCCHSYPNLNVVTVIASHSGTSPWAPADVVV